MVKSLGSVISRKSIIFFEESGVRSQESDCSSYVLMRKSLSCSSHSLMGADIARMVLSENSSFNIWVRVSRSWSEMRSTFVSTIISSFFESAAVFQCCSVATS